jgi:signal transduction histidine kinase
MSSQLPSLDLFSASRILVIDDNPSNLDLLVTVLSRAGISQVLTESDARMALSRIETDAPELVMLDLHMPYVDGYEVLSLIREKWAPLEVPVVVLTADTTRQAARRALGLGANEFITKPIDIAEVLLRVRNLLEAHMLHMALQERERWVHAAGQLAGDLLAGNVDEPVPLIAALSRDLADADVVIVSVDSAHSTMPSHLVLGDAGGVSSEQVAQLLDPIVTGLTLDGGSPVIFDDHAHRGAMPDSPFGPVMVLPLTGSTGVRGALSLCRGRGREPFGSSQFDAAQTFARQAALAVEFADSRREQARMLILEDRDRIARDLHDHVIQRLFAMGLRMQATPTAEGNPDLPEVITGWAEELDETILQIRSAIFMLRDTKLNSVRSLRSRLRATAHDVSDALGFEPHLHVVGPLDSTVSGEVADDVIAVVREALTNVVKHAQASRAVVAVIVAAGRLRIEVTDDGVGVGPTQRRSGIGNLETRAQRHGGTFLVEPAPHGGTAVTWDVPMRQPSAP